MDHANSIWILDLGLEQDPDMYHADLNRVYNIGPGS